MSHPTTRPSPDSRSRHQLAGARPGRLGGASLRRPADHAALVAQAREYRSAIRPYKVSHRPHGVLVREAAELRRFLGYALDALQISDCGGYTEGLRGRGRCGRGTR